MTRLAYPFAIAASGRSATVDYGSDAHVADMLRQLILTSIGERVMRPEFGSPIRQMLFGAGNGPAAIALQATLQATIAQWLGHVLELQDLSVEFGEGTGVLLIDVTYEVLATKQAGKVRVRKDLT